MELAVALLVRQPDPQRFARGLASLVAGAVDGLGQLDEVEQDLADRRAPALPSWAESRCSTS
ncbi:hypothetical protein [Actinokineospora sp. NBRC 105648]|uniref:hypothetical protein n=1 Tax=Actinokineospora sp. NBRC 105648 TaxID=3032206 RepID=UPI0025548C22|nr:hypothetical protein [Actinokineospora sp. NBRC 105648]